MGDIGPDSQWQTGPSFLSSRRETWPVSREFLKNKIDLPDQELRSKNLNIFAAVKASSNLKVCSEMPKLWKTITDILLYTDSLNKVLNILCRVIRGYKSGTSIENISKDPVASELQQAEKLVLLSAMPLTYQAFEQGKLESLMAYKKGSIIVTTGRFGEKSLSALLGVSHLPILMPSSRAAFLFMVRAHRGNDDLVHKSAVETLARSREHVWIVRGKTLAKSVVKGCKKCAKDKKEMCSQQIAKMKPENLEMCKPWTYISLDFAGPVKVKGIVNPRTRKKCWILVYVCRNTKAVCLLATAGYDTASFLLRHEEFVARHGAPKEIVSDQGSQLIAAGDIISSMQVPYNWDWSKVEKENRSSVWKFVPVSSQHHNGLPEAMVKALKRALNNTLQSGEVLTYDELVTLLARISSSINSRPLGLSSTSNSDQQEDILLPLTPNHMLLGRSSPETPHMEYSKNDKFCNRVALVAKIEDEWWRRWKIHVLPTLFPARKWKKAEENLIVGDIVLLLKAGLVKNSYTLARITKVYPDENNLVRKVQIKYRRTNNNEARDVCKSTMEFKDMAVQNLSLVEPVPRS